MPSIQEAAELPTLKPISSKGEPAMFLIPTLFCRSVCRENLFGGNLQDASKMHV